MNGPRWIHKKDLTRAVFSKASNKEWEWKPSTTAKMMPNNTSALSLKDSDLEEEDSSKKVKSSTKANGKLE
jgi:hypothetical protein